MILSLYVSTKKPLLCIVFEKPNKALGVRCVDLRSLTGTSVADAPSR